MSLSSEVKGAPAKQLDARRHCQLTEKSCCKRAYLCGAFLASGSISNLEKLYHFEIVCQNPAQAGHLQELCKGFELDAKIVRRKKYYVVYIKKGGVNHRLRKLSEIAGKLR